MPKSILSPKGGHCGGFGPGFNYTFLRHRGRTFLLAYGKATVLSELLPDGSLHDLAAVAECHQFCYYCDWKPPQAYIDAFFRAYPDKKGGGGVRNRAPYAQKGPGMLWVDRNGDGRMQADEFSFSIGAEIFGGAGWGHAFNSLSIKVPAVVAGRMVLVTLKPDGFEAGEAPRYPPLARAIAEAVPLAPRPANNATPRRSRTASAT